MEHTPRRFHSAIAVQSRQLDAEWLDRSACLEPINISSQAMLSMMGM